MKRLLHKCRMIPMGIVYAMIAVILSGMLIRRLGGLVEMTGLVSDDVVQALIQLEEAVLVSPWTAAAAAGAAVGVLWMRRCRRMWLRLVLWTVMLIPATLTAAWFTVVNDVSMGAMLKTLASLLPGLL